LSNGLTTAYLAATRGMAGGAPRPILKRAEMEATDLGSPDVGLAALCAHLRLSNPDDLLRRQIHLAVAGWDSADASESWTEGTVSYSPERRLSVYRSLDLDESSRDAFTAVFPISTAGAVVISEEFEPWYAQARRDEGSLYWTTYKNYLLTVRRWRGDSIERLEDATTSVVERLSDPRRPQAYQAKGLVVGYVQSGKTAHFTGVIAKAIDAGYRLVIVLTGTIDLLRQQTQRRIDMELVGVENIIRRADPAEQAASGYGDYHDDPEWKGDRFVRYGFLPSDQGYPDIIRLTSHRVDYKGLQSGITALELEKVDKAKPLFDAVNLRSSGARLVVVKKNKHVLTKLVRDLKSIRPHLGEIPAIIIDDESDHSSVNTSDPKKWVQGRPQRTAINGLISQLLALLPRSQYVGYTATPYANVFIDPSDTQDIFPKDFLISLEKAPHYMGVTDFHDLDSTLEPEERTYANSNELAYVRDLRGFGSQRNPEMALALDAFVLSGAMKLFRSKHTEQPDLSRHHTMLVHETVRQVDHRVLAEEFRNVWRQAGYSTATALPRLRALFERDFQPVSLVRAESWPIPGTFAELVPFVGEAVSRISESAGDPVLIVNGDTEIQQQRLDFDKTGVWRVLVGGTKLSRGFTVEGLTISYYRRLTKQADTLMQMGRWFGFREGYKDLVRLFVGRAEPDGSRTVDLYRAFEAIVRDEEAFREQLRQYARLVDGKPQVTPRQIPPLVSQHLPFIAPSAPNKMFNAQLVLHRTPGHPVEPTAYPLESAALVRNYDRLAPIAAAANALVQFKNAQGLEAGATRFDAFVGAVSHADLIIALKSYEWLTLDYFVPNLAYLREIGDLGQVSDWVVILPQTHEEATLLHGIGKRSVHRRERRRHPLFGAISDPKHRGVAHRIAGSAPGFSDPLAATWASDRRGALLIYPVVETQGEAMKRSLPAQRAIMAFCFIAPATAVAASGQVVQFVARNVAHDRDVVVSV
jgi:hypothetical protein